MKNSTAWEILAERETAALREPVEASGSKKKILNISRKGPPRKADQRY